VCPTQHKWMPRHIYYVITLHIMLGWMQGLLHGIIPSSFRYALADLLGIWLGFRSGSERLGSLKLRKFFSFWAMDPAHSFLPNLHEILVHRTNSMNSSVWSALFRSLCNAGNTSGCTVQHSLLHNSLPLVCGKNARIHSLSEGGNYIVPKWECS
jgi:hypothetical protein